jgi:U3 small nucleolar RNA-associated protein 14
MDSHWWKGTTAVNKLSVQEIQEITRQLNLMIAQLFTVQREMERLKALLDE